MPRVASIAVAWPAWSATTKATAVLVSSRASTLLTSGSPGGRDPLALVGIAQALDHVGGQLRPRDPDDQAFTLQYQRAIRDRRLDAQTRSVHLDIHLRWTEQSDPLPHGARDHQPSCRVDGGSHAMTLPRRWCPPRVS